MVADLAEKKTSRAAGCACQTGTESGSIRTRRMAQRRPVERIEKVEHAVQLAMDYGSTLSDDKRVTNFEMDSSEAQGTSDSTDLIEAGQRGKAKPGSAGANEPVKQSINIVPRAELAGVLTQLTRPVETEDQALVWNITGMRGAGKSVSLSYLANLAADRQITTLPAFSLRQRLESHPTLRSATQSILRDVAAAVGVAVEELLREVPGEATLKEMASRIRNELEQQPKQGLLLTFDDTDDSTDTQDLMVFVEDFLFTRLLEAGRSGAAILVAVASRASLRWRFVGRNVRTIALQPFGPKELSQQLKCSIAEAERISAVTGGLPGAAKLIWASGQAKTSSPRDLFHMIFESFVQPTLGADPLLADAVKAAALLCRGFTVTDLMRVLREVSYLAGRYTATNSTYYYSVINSMHRLRLISYSEQDKSYHLEPHLHILLNLWNEYENPRAAADRELADKRAPRLLQAMSSTREHAFAPASPDSPPQDGATSSLESLAPIYDHIVSRARRASGRFASRTPVVEQLAAYLCRRSERQIDIIFLVGSPGSGKTELLRHLSQLATDAVNTYKSRALLVTGDFADKGEPSQSQGQLARDNIDPDDPEETLDYTGSRLGIIDQETSVANRPGAVRRAIMDRLVEAIVREQLRARPDKPDAESTNPLDVRRKYFGKYAEALGKWQALRNSLRLADGSVRRPLVRAKQQQARLLGRAVEREFIEACREVARIEGSDNERRRILLVLDTFDYPVRSGPYAAQVVADIAATLAGDYCFLIACRPPIQAEIVDPFIAGDLRKYLPDDVRDQAEVLNLDDPGTDADRPWPYRLRPQDVEDFYGQRPWYDPALQGARDLRAAMTQVVVERDSLPVLLGLLEFYSGVNAPPNHSPIPALNDLGSQADLVRELSGLPDEDFAWTVISGLLFKAPASAGSENDTYRWALQLMSLIDRGLSFRMLREMADSINDTVRLNVDEIWQAILHIYGADSANGMGSTLVKLTIGPSGEDAYKLHDYMSLLFDRYIAHTLASIDAANMIGWRQPIMLAALGYVLQQGNFNQPDPNADVHTREERRRHILYQAARTYQVYYALRLAAIRRQEEALTTRPEKASALDPATPWHVSGRFSSSQLADALGLGDRSGPTLSAAGTTAVVCRYLLDKISHELDEYMEYGFGGVLLQEVRYYLHDQGQPSRPICNPTLPLGETGLDMDTTWQKSRAYYQAALLKWELESDQFPSAEPWLRNDGQGRMSTWRSDREWHEIVALLPEDPERLSISSRECQRQHADWLVRQGHSVRAHAAYALLAAAQRAEHELGPEYVESLLRQARAAIANPLDIHYIGRRARREGAGGLRAAELYLLDARAAALAVDPLVLGLVHTRYGALCRMLERLDWYTQQGPPDALAKNLTAWGALQHYDQALRLLKRALAAPSFDAKYRIAYARALIGRSYVLMQLGKLQAASMACRQAIDFLTDVAASLNEFNPLRRRALDALGHAYATRAEISRYKAEDHSDRQEWLAAIDEYRRGQEDYDAAANHLDSTNREWQAIIAALKSHAGFWCELAHFEANRDKRYDKDTLLRPVRALRQALHYLLPKDLPDAYRRLGRIYSRLHRLGIEDPDSWELDARGNDRFVVHLSGSAKRAYICFVQAYETARRIDSHFNELISISDRVILLGRCLGDPNMAVELYEESMNNLTGRELMVTRYRLERVMGQSIIAIGLAYLSKAKTLPEASPERDALLDKAATHLETGFDLLPVRSRHDVGEFHRRLDDLSALLPVFGDKLGALHGHLEHLTFDGRWQELLEEMALLLNHQFAPPMK